MRSTFTGLNTMVRGIFNNQISLDTTGHNITNAGTDGYSRQGVNSAATRCQEQSSLYGNVMVGTGVDALSIQRARNIYADIQYRNENPTQQYYKTLMNNYDKLETIFDDSRDLGIEAAMGKFYQSWVDLSTTASNASSRTQVIEHGRELTEIIQSSLEELQQQITSQYNDIREEVGDVDQLMEEITSLNNQIIVQEITGAMANDLRDQRDVLTDELSKYLNINVVEDEKGAYIINSGGVTLINGVERTHLAMGNGVSSSLYGVDYGIVDYDIKIVESTLSFLPQNGILRARYDAIEENKSYIDKLVDISNFLLSTFNDQHRQGWDLEGHSTTDASGNIVPDTINFFGQENYQYEYRYEADRNINYLYNYGTQELLSGVQIIAELQVNTKFQENRGDRYVAAATSRVEETDANGNPINGQWTDMEWGDRTGDGTNAVYLSELFNIHLETITNAEPPEGNTELMQTYILRDKNGTAILDANGNEQLATAIAKLSINSYYQRSMAQLGMDAHAADVDYEAMDVIMIQISNWRDQTAGVDWNEELTNMIKFQKGYASCSRCLTTMDEMLDRLINNTGVVGR
ncbi:MAG: flagellar hook-associated protein FlgK [Selenomonadaceae bacterium]|nr:flagellar hook-associated protein FlgK [Selenomonadaceae bacterium]MBR4381939.1 flagellar hook-associated protein FlgK [Selenomonadaceae bacterium]